MSPTLTDETRRRLALGLIEKPVNHNRRRLRRTPRRDHHFNLAAVLVGGAILIAAFIISKL